MVALSFGTASFYDDHIKALRCSAVVTKILEKMLMKNFFEHCNERTILVTTVPDLEVAIRNVLSDVLEQKAKDNNDAKIKRSAACKRLGKTPSSLYRWEQAGKLHPIKIGRDTYYWEREIVDIEEGRV